MKTSISYILVVTYYMLAAKRAFQRLTTIIIIKTMYMREYERDSYALRLLVAY